MATFGERLSELRSRLKLSQEELAARFNISKSAVGMYERDQREPSFDLVKGFADFFEVSVDYLMGAKVGKQDDLMLDGGRAFYGGADKYSEEELEIADAAAKAAIEAYRKGLNKKK